MQEVFGFVKRNLSAAQRRKSAASGVRGAGKGAAALVPASAHSDPEREERSELKLTSEWPTKRELSRQPSLVTIGSTRRRGPQCILVHTMLRSFAPVVISLVLAHLTAHGQPSKTPSTRDDEKQLLALERQWVDAEVKHDAAFLDRILDDRFIVINSQGRTRDKAAFVAALLKSAGASQTLSDETVRIFGDTAIILGTDTVQPTDGKAPYSVRYMTVYAKRKGRWTAVAEEFSSVAAPAKQ